MDGIKYSGRFAEMEGLMSDYFNIHIVPVMSKTQTFLVEKQGEEMKEYSTSLGGVLGMMASSAQPMNDTYQLLQVTGEWNSKTTEDYIGMCKAEITGSKEMQQDLAYMAGQWRDTLVQEIGRARYNELSEQLGGDLAYAYLDYRMNQLMIDQLVKERMPKSSAEYIIRKAAGSSLLGLSQALNRSPLAEQIEKQGEIAYRPSTLEKGAGWVLGATSDSLMLGGTGPWAMLARIGTDTTISAVSDYIESDEPIPLSAEQYISKGVFGSESNVFDGFRKEAAKLPVQKNTAIIAANEQLNKKIPLIDFGFQEWPQSQQAGLTWLNVQDEEERKHTGRYKDVPLVVASGQEDAYLQDMEKRGKKTMAETKQMLPEKEARQTVEKEKHKAVASTRNEKLGEQGMQGAQQVTQNKGNGWDGLLGTLGLNGMGDVAGNLGYVAAMLPDVLLGAFTGKSPSLQLGNNLLPIASIVMGIFVRNPLLKMLLIGLGGMNLLNKAGHEALHGRTADKANDVGNMQYRHYANEPLNPRIVNPVLQGNTLIATIDRVPCTIQLPPHVAEAYRSGALPLNTLVNAVLAKSDQLRQAAAQNYENGQQETIARPRGIQ